MLRDVSFILIAPKVQKTVKKKTKVNASLNENVHVKYDPLLDVSALKRSILGGNIKWDLWRPL